MMTKSTKNILLLTRWNRDQSHVLFVTAYFHNVWFGHFFAFQNQIQWTNFFDKQRKWLLTLQQRTKKIFHYDASWHFISIRDNKKREIETTHLTHRKICKIYLFQLFMHEMATKQLSFSICFTVLRFHFSFGLSWFSTHNTVSLVVNMHAKRLLNTELVSEATAVTGHINGVTSFAWSWLIMPIVLNFRNGLHRFDAFLSQWREWCLSNCIWRWRDESNWNSLWNWKFNATIYKNKRHKNYQRK